MKYQNKSFSVPVDGSGAFPCAHKRERTEYPYGKGHAVVLWTTEGRFIVRSQTRCTICDVVTHEEFEKV